jgi:hypothetical protein
VEIVWLVNPEDRSVLVYRADQPIPQLYEENDKIAAEGILPSFRYPVAEFFQVPGKGTAQPEQSAS